ncbi:DgyrCDS2163 [Dimorphilus gyrociliatus]|uniref:DgyrCDS2163 n=1 Tax=Dimorphilus gyrociliatus TaxID=2664684 RepID=A0A7I8V9E9_9ANNE|nr:DgyrCDS2163 [Dimorphilus gyrociliatus]
MRIPEIKEETDFSEYVWMGEELEEFDRKVVAELEEQYEMEEEFEKFLEQQVVYYIDFALDDDGIPLAQVLRYLDDLVRNSKLNPNAPEFVPKNFVQMEEEEEVDVEAEFGEDEEIVDR